MSYYLKSGTTYRVTSKEALDLHEKLPPGNYVIKADMNGNLFLDTINEFEMKGKRYGDLNTNCERILNTFANRPNSTGVMLAGEKGSGKSMLAKAVCMKGVELGYPTIVINSAMSGDRFNAFLQEIEQPTIILFDEFEKVYEKDDQEAILTLLDGVFPSKKLFIFTCNDKWRIDEHMRNRPGRIFYMIDFAGLSCDFIIEYCKDNLKNQDHIEKICAIATLFHRFNFDMLKALVEEMNRYNESPELALRILNVKPEYDKSRSKYDVELILNGIPFSKEDLEDQVWEGNPLQDTIHITYKYRVKNNSKSSTRKRRPSRTSPSELAEIPELRAVVNTDDSDDENIRYNDIIFTSADLKKIEPHSNKFVFVNGNNTLVLTRQEEKPVRYLDF